MAPEPQHVLNDRVTAVLGFSELLLEESYGSLTPQQRKVLSTVVMRSAGVTASPYVTLAFSVA